MAGIVRQPIDLESLQRYISQSVPIIKTPIELKQVQSPAMAHGIGSNECDFVVWFWPVESYVPDYGQQWGEVRYAEEAPGKAGLKDGASG